MDLMRRIRWGNVARATAVLAVIGLLIAWPSLRSEPPPLPADPGPAPGRAADRWVEDGAGERAPGATPNGRAEEGADEAAPDGTVEGQVEGGTAGLAAGRTVERWAEDGAAAAPASERQADVRSHDRVTQPGIEPRTDEDAKPTRRARRRRAAQDRRGRRRGAAGRTAIRPAQPPTVRSGATAVPQASAPPPAPAPAVGGWAPPPGTEFGFE